MANITFTIPSVLNGGAGEKKTNLDANTLNDAFAKISETMGDDFKRRVLNEDGTPRSLINIYINGKNAKFSSGLDTTLSDGDEVSILPAVAGGSSGTGGMCLTFLKKNWTDILDKSCWKKLVIKDN